MKRQQSLEARQVARVYRALADEHVEDRTVRGEEALWGRLVARRAHLAVAPDPVASRWHLWAAVAAICLVVGGAGWLGLAREAGALEFEVRGGQRSGQLVATEDERATLAFSDGSSIVLEPRTTFRVELAPGARVVGSLSQGALEVSVRHRPETDYRFHAGPFEVRVIGTAFRLEFEPEAQSLELEVREGRVQVLGEGREVFVGGGEARSFAPSALALPLPAPRDPGDAERRVVSLAELDGMMKQAEAALGISDEGASAPLRSEPASAVAPSFARWAAAGRFAEIVRFAEERGVERVLADKSAEELQELAQAARYTGRSALAERVWKHLWSHASGRAVGVDAAFFLGRLADQAGRNREALEWLRAYLGRAPRGNYAAEALGRELALVQRSEGSSAARPVARRYLARFPEGPYASQARALLGEPE